MAAALRPWTDPVSGVAVGALLVTALVVARQLITVRENVRLLADTAARQNEARFRSLVQHSSDVIMVTRPNGTIRFVSPSVSRVLRLRAGCAARAAVVDAAASRRSGSGHALFCREAGRRRA